MRRTSSKLSNVEEKDYKTEFWAVIQNKDVGRT